MVQTDHYTTGEPCFWLRMFTRVLWRLAHFADGLSEPKLCNYQYRVYVSCTFSPVPSLRFFVQRLPLARLSADAEAARR